MERVKEYVDILLAISADGFILPVKLRLPNDEV